MAGIYLHVPFCKRRCIYCDFFSTTQSERKTAYIHAVCSELEMRKEYLGGETIETIYWGGGTPSQLDKEDFETIFYYLHKNYSISSHPEITLEANPDDLTPDYIAMLRTLPFNRLSMGIQTFNESILKVLQRRHTARQAIEAFQNCRAAGFQNISIDLMYGLPGETLSTWQQDLDQALLLHPEHLSAYHLIYEEDTVLWKLREQHKVEEADEDLSVSLFSTLIDRLTSEGYDHYEISNFSLPGLLLTPQFQLLDREKVFGLRPFRPLIQWRFPPMECRLTGYLYKRNLRRDTRFEIEELIYIPGITTLSLPASARNGVCHCQSYVMNLEKSCTTTVSAWLLRI